eukprot:g1650.t1
MTNQNKNLLNRFLSAIKIADAGSEHTSFSQFSFSQVRPHEQELALIIQETSEEELLGLIDSSHSEGRRVVEALLSVVRVKGSRWAFQVIKQCVNSMNRGRMIGSVAQKITHRLVSECDELSTGEITQLVEIIVQGLGEPQQQLSDARYDGAALELIPKLLSKFEDHKKYQIVVNKDTDATEMYGGAYRGYVIQSICRMSWPSSAVVALTTLLKEIPLTSGNMNLVIRKVLKQFSRVPIQELPGLMYQLLLLATDKCKKHILHQITCHFDEIDEREHLLEGNTKDSERRRLRQVEGTVLLHFNFAMKQDQSLGKAVLSGFKTDGRALSRFQLALLFSMATVPRFSDEVFGIIKQRVLRYHQSVARFRESPWLRYEACEVRKLIEREKNADNVSNARMDMFAESESVNVESLILQTIECSTSGWDHILPSILELGVMLLDLSTHGAAKSKQSNSNFILSTHAVTLFDKTNPFADALAEAKGSIGPIHEAKQLVARTGLRILARLFRIQNESVRGHILEQILSRVMSRAPTVRAYLILLATISIDTPSLLLPFAQKLKESLEYCPLLPTDVARSLLSALEPVVMLRPDLRDYTVIVLRKAMFKREAEARIVAVEGLLRLLLQIKSVDSNGNPLLQTLTAGSSTEEHNPDHDHQIRFWRQIVGLLRRALGQQNEVRVALYDGLARVFKSLPVLRSDVAMFLIPHAKKYTYLTENSENPIFLEKCIAPDGTTKEPIGALLRCIRQCIKISSKEEMENGITANLHTSCITEMSRILKSIVVKMGECELSDFELDTTTTFSEESTDGRRNISKANLLASVFDVMLEFAVDKVSFGNKEQTLFSKLAIRTLQRRLALQTLLRDSSVVGRNGSAKNGGKRKRGRKGKNLCVLTPIGGSISWYALVWLLESFVKKTEENEAANETAQALANSSMISAYDAILPEGQDADMLRFVLAELCTLLEMTESKEAYKIASVIGPLLLRGFESWRKAEAILAIHEKKKKETKSPADNQGENGEGNKGKSKGKGKKGKGKPKKTGKRPGLPLSLITISCLETATLTAINGRIDTLSSSEPNHSTPALPDSFHQRAQAAVDFFSVLFPQQKKPGVAMIQRAIENFESLVDELLNDKLFKHANRVMSIISACIELLPLQMKSLHGKWVKETCSEFAIPAVFSNLKKKLLAHTLQLNRNAKNGDALLGLSKALQLKTTDMQNGESIHDEWKDITSHTSVAIVANVLLSELSLDLGNISSVLTKLRYMRIHQEVAGPNQQQHGELASPAIAAENILREQMAYARFSKIIRIVSCLLKCKLSIGKEGDALVRVLQTCYKLLSDTVKINLAQPEPTDALTLFRKLHIDANKIMKPAVEEFMNFARTGGGTVDVKQSKGQKKKRATKASIMKQSRLFPTLIFGMEQMEMSYLKLKKVKPEADLTKFCRNATARDFRLQKLDQVVDRQKAGDCNKEDPSSQEEDDVEVMKRSKKKMEKRNKKVEEEEEEEEEESEEEEEEESEEEEEEESEEEEDPDAYPSDMLVENESSRSNKRNSSSNSVKANIKRRKM